MSVTILETLQNARINLIDNANVPLARTIGMNQLDTAIALLEKEYHPYVLVEPLIEKHGTIENVPYFIER